MFMKNHNITLVLSALLLLAGAETSLRAQLVADGATATINGTSTNITDVLIIGTNGCCSVIFPCLGVNSPAGFAAKRPAILISSSGCWGFADRRFNP
jgi:hypothetical protein